ncbi:unnamed protein product [Boreogadus saida]
MGVAAGAGKHPTPGSPRGWEEDGVDVAMGTSDRTCPASGDLLDQGPTAQRTRQLQHQEITTCRQYRYQEITTYRQYRYQEITTYRQYRYQEITTYRQYRYQEITTYRQYRYQEITTYRQYRYQEITGQQGSAPGDHHLQTVQVPGDHHLQTVQVPGDHRAAGFSTRRSPPTDSTGTRRSQGSRVQYQVQYQEITTYRQYRYQEITGQQAQYQVQYQVQYRETSRAARSELSSIMSVGSGRGHDQDQIVRPSYLPGELRARHSHTALGPTEAADWTAPPGATQGGGGGGSSDATLNRDSGTAGQLGLRREREGVRGGKRLRTAKTPAEDADVEAHLEGSGVPEGCLSLSGGAPGPERGGACCGLHNKEAAWRGRVSGG